MTDLSSWLNYTNPRVVAYFSHHHEINKSKSKVLFSDLMGWLWLNVQRKQQDKKTYLFGPLLILDEMWHAFILHTRDYYEFSSKFYGSYLHHDIEPIGQEYELNEEAFQDFLHECFEHLGEEWVARRFSEALVFEK